MKNYNYKKNTLFSTLAIVLVFIMLASAVGYFSKGFKDWNAKDWFKDKNPEVETTDSLILDGDGKKMDGATVYPLPASMRYVPSAFSTELSTNVTVEANFYPLNATNTKVDWSIAWQNPNSEFASGKNVNDYVIVGAVTDGSLRANVNFVAPFGEVIILTVTYRLDSNIYADCFIDCMARVSGMNLVISTNVGEIDCSYSVSDSENILWQYLNGIENLFRLSDFSPMSIDYMPHTMEDEFITTSIMIRPEVSFLEFFDYEGYNCYENSFEFDFGYLQGVTPYASVFDYFLSSYGVEDSFDPFYKETVMNSSDIFVWLDVVISGEYSDVSFSVGWSYEFIAIEQLQLDGDPIVF